MASLLTLYDGAGRQTESMAQPTWMFKIQRQTDFDTSFLEFLTFTKLIQIGGINSCESKVWPLSKTKMVLCEWFEKSLSGCDFYKDIVHSNKISSYSSHKYSKI